MRHIPLGDRDVDFDELFIDVTPTWLPDGSGVTFSRSIWRDGEFAGNQIVTVPVTGGEPEVLTTVTPDTPGVVYFGMRWTADGSAALLRRQPSRQRTSRTASGASMRTAPARSNLAGIDPELGPPVLGGISPDGDTVSLYYALHGRCDRRVRRQSLRAARCSDRHAHPGHPGEHRGAREPPASGRPRFRPTAASCSTPPA